MIKDEKLVFQIQNLLYRIVYTDTWNINYGTFCLQNTEVHVNIYGVIGHKTIKTKQMPYWSWKHKISKRQHGPHQQQCLNEWYIYNYTKSVTIKKC